MKLSPKELEKYQVQIAAIGKKRFDEDRTTRERLLKYWRRADNYWHGIQTIFWDSQLSDWFDFSNSTILGNYFNTENLDDLDLKVYNIYKAHGESIIAALSIEVPSILFPPDDPDNPDDIRTSEAKNTASQIIYNHNRAELLFLRAAYCLYNHGFFAGYISNKESYKFGKYVKEERISVSRDVNTYTCPECGTENEVPQVPCPECGSNQAPIEGSSQKEFLETKETEHPKERILIDIFSPQYFKVNLNARIDSDVRYLILQEEFPVSQVIDQYPHIADKIGPYANTNDYERRGRLHPFYGDQETEQVCQVTKVWLEPSEYYVLSLDDAKELKKRFPNGLKACFVNNWILAEIIPESLHACWAFPFHPLATHLQADPIGHSEMDLQDSTNDLLNLTLETIRHGIPENFADNRVLDFNSYGTIEKRPGLVFPAQAQANKSLSDGFHSTRTASLGPEHASVGRYLTEAAQFAIGSFPSIYGGVNLGGGKTAAEYESSKNSALQRLSIPWKVITYFWTSLTDRAVEKYISYIRDNNVTENQVTGSPGQWKKKSVRPEDLTGRTGDTTPRHASAYPLTYGQKRDWLMKLLQFNNPIINSVITHPNNAGIVRDYLGFPEMYIPGTNDRIYFLIVIQELLNSPPIDEMTSSVQPQEFEDNQIAIEVIKNWLKSSDGQTSKIENDEGYLNVLIHLKQRQELLMQQTMQQQPGSQQGELPVSEVE